MDKELAKDKIKKLVEKYHILTEAERNKYNEEQTKNYFIRPLFEALGWNFSDSKEVSMEEAVLGKRADYEFRIHGIPKFYAEAKPIRADLDLEQYARQAINYAWNKGANWAVLTDFESIKIFNALAHSKLLADKLVFEIPVTEYESDFDRLWLLSKESFSVGALDTYAEKYGKKIKRLMVNEKLFGDLKEARETLTASFKMWNEGKVDAETLEEGVQRILDRLVFIRVLEDRGLEQNILKQVVREREARGTNAQLFPLLVEKFKDLDEHYNSNIFKRHACDVWEEHDDKLKKVILSLYGNEIYEYNFKDIPTDILGGVYESYLGYIAQKPIEANKSGKPGSLFKVEDKKEVKAKSRQKRKEQGIYYTPKFIVDYIVKNSLGEKLKEIKSVGELKKLKVLDPACGSGSFLTAALSLINEKYKEFGAPGDQRTKTSILLENIYGVDLDSQAVELAKLNLLIRALDKKEKLPDLTNNIRVGNSLISGTDEELKKFFGKNYRDKKPFNWQGEFPEVFKQGGFDVVIGNPPYVNLANIKSAQEREFLRSNYKTAKNKSDLYSFMTERAVSLLKPKGCLGYIFSNSWLGTDSFSEFRKFLIENTVINSLVKLPADVFAQAAVTTVLIFLEKEKAESNYEIPLLQYVDGNFQKLPNKLSYIRIKANPGYSFSFEQETSFHIQTISLGKIAKFSLGIKTSNDEKFILDEKKDNNTFPLLRGKDVFRYNYKYADKWLWYRPELMMEKVGAGPRKPEYFLASKILFRSITGGSVIATLDEEKYFTNDKVHILYEIEGFDLKLILGIVNSKLIDKWVHSTFGNLLEIKINQLEQIPIPVIKQKDSSVIKKLVDTILGLNKKIIDIPENSDQWQRLKEEIVKTDQKIDEEVYKLYGLTEEEIKVVEGK
ncbi:MAG: N-6 DNA methylase [Candidatus Magasanikbacteria bacterium]|nr:N-6 DNA methylase [Candidatus Magasanikbacteria bacterium]